MTDAWLLLNLALAFLCGGYLIFVGLHRLACYLADHDGNLGKWKD